MAFPRSHSQQEGSWDPRPGGVALDLPPHHFALLLIKGMLLCLGTLNQRQTYRAKPSDENILELVVMAGNCVNTLKTTACFKRVPFME